MNHPLTATSFHNDELITTKQMCQLFLKQAPRTFRAQRAKLEANGFPKPDKRFRSLKYHVGKIRAWIADDEIEIINGDLPEWTPQPIKTFGKSIETEILANL